jgi:hypothetical protein
MTHEQEIPFRKKEYFSFTLDLQDRTTSHKKMEQYLHLQRQHFLQQCFGFVKIKLILGNKAEKGVLA